MPIISVKRHLIGDLYLPKGTPLAERIRWNSLLRRLAKAAKQCKQIWSVGSGYRSREEQAALFEQNMLAPGVPKPGRPLTAVPGTSNHEGGKAADVQARRSRVETDISRDDLLRGERIEPFRIGHLMDIASLVEQAQQVGFVMGHSGRALSTRHTQ